MQQGYKIFEKLIAKIFIQFIRNQTNKQIKSEIKKMDSSFRFESKSTFEVGLRPTLSWELSIAETKANQTSIAPQQNQRNRQQQHHSSQVERCPNRLDKINQ